MNKKKAVVCTILFAIIVMSIIITSMIVKPYGGEVSLFHAFSPAIVGLWVAELIDKFYEWLTK